MDIKDEAKRQLIKVKWFMLGTTAILLTLLEVFYFAVIKVPAIECLIEWVVVMGLGLGLLHFSFRFIYRLQDRVSEQKNQLATQFSARLRAEEALRKAHDDLEQRVEERTAELTAANMQLRQEITVRQRTEEALKNAAVETVEVLSRVVEAKDPYTSGHSARVTEIAIKIAQEIGLTNSHLDTLRMAGLLHDLGKVGMPSSVLNKPARWTQAEWVMIQAHPVMSAQIADRVAAFKDAVPAIRHHHEEWDGTGYPDGLKGDDIPLLARILAVADGFEAMTSERPYRARMSTLEALTILKKGAGTQWDPHVVDPFVKIYEEGALKEWARNQ